MATLRLEVDDGFASLGLSNQEIEEQKNALRKIQAQQRRGEHRRISAALRNRKRSPPPSSQEGKLPEEYEIPGDGFSTNMSTNPTHADVIISDEEDIQQQRHILQNIARFNSSHSTDIGDSFGPDRMSDCKPFAQSNDWSSSNVVDVDQTAPSDKLIIAEQKRLLDHIQAIRAEAHLHSLPFPPQPGSDFALEPDSCSSVGRSYAGSKETANGTHTPLFKNNRNQHFPDSTFRIGNKTSVRIKGTHHVYDRIMNGKKTVFTRCAMCETISQVDGESSRLFYCTICQHVVPIQEVSTSHHDTSLVTVLQNQEKAAAAVRQSMNLRTNLT